MDFPVSGIEVSPFIPPVVAFVISFFTSMGGVSGAFLLLPFQFSVLGFTSPSVSPTNLVFNIVAIPSGVYRYIKEGRMAWPVAYVIVVGTLPGVFIGAFVRIKYLPDPAAFKVFAGSVLLYISIQLLYKTIKQYYYKNNSNDAQKQNNAAVHKCPEGKIRTVKFSLKRYEFEYGGTVYGFNPPVLFMISFIVGIIGGTYGIGGGSIIAPFCVALLGLPVYTVAGAALLGTLVTSVAGIGYYYIADLMLASSGISVLPDWKLGILFGIGGFAGMYFGARCQKHVPELWIRLLLSAVLLILAGRYIVQFFF